MLKKCLNHTGLKEHDRECLNSLVSHREGSCDCTQPQQKRGSWKGLCPHPQVPAQRPSDQVASSHMLGVVRCLSTSFFVWALSLCCLVYHETVTRSGNEKLKISKTSEGLTAIFCCLNFKVGISQESKSHPVPICRCPVCRVHRFLPWKPQAPARTELLPIDGILGPSNIGPNALSPVSSLRKTRATLEALQGGGWTQLLKSRA